MMKFRKILKGWAIVLALIITSISCNNKEYTKGSFLTFDTLYLDTKTTQVGQLSGRVIYPTSTDTMLIAADYINKAIHIFSLSSELITKSIYFDKEGDEGIPSFARINVLNDTTILIDGFNMFYLVDWDGRIKKTYRHRTSGDIIGLDPSKGEIRRFNVEQVYDRKRNWFYMGYLDYEKKGFTPQIVALDFDTDSLHYFDIPDIPYLQNRVNFKEYNITATPNGFVFNIKGLSSIYSYTFSEGFNVHHESQSGYTINEAPRFKEGMDKKAYQYLILFWPLQYSIENDLYFGVHYRGELAEEEKLFYSYLRVISYDFKLVDEFPLGNDFFPKPIYFENSVYFFLKNPKTENPIPIVKVTYHLRG